MREHANDENRFTKAAPFKREILRMKAFVGDKAISLEAAIRRERETATRDVRDVREDVMSKLAALRSQCDAVVSSSTSIDSVLVLIRRMYRGEADNIKRSCGTPFPAQ